MFSLLRLFGLTTHYLYSMKRNPARLIEMIVWPSFEVVLFGFLAQSVTNTQQTLLAVGTKILTGIVVWNFFARIIQESVAQFLDDAFSKNVQNIFITPITTLEFVLSIVIASITKLVISLLILLTIVSSIYPSLFITLEIPAFFWAFFLILFGSILSLYALGLIFIVGERLSFIGWIISTVVQIFSCVFYDRSVLPEPLKSISYAFPSSYIFESIRSYIATGIIHFDWIRPSLLLLVCYGIVGILFFRYSLAVSRRNGRLAKL